MDTLFISLLSNVLNAQITTIQPVSSGDISKAFLIKTSNTQYFLKTNILPNALLLFQSEVNGLNLIRNTNTINTPKVIHCDTWNNQAFLILEYIETKPATTSDFKLLARQLAALHNHKRNTFGLDKNNFIGNLPQSNTSKNSWSEFYIQERLKPQLQFAETKKLLSPEEIPSDKNLKKTLKPLFQNIKPSLLHGDLWSGNYLISKSGTPYLIDPAIYYGHAEVDIAMTKLFGGFENSFYIAYHDIRPTDSNSDLRIELYQLYYLLVHLNLFGNSYRTSVINILKKFF